VICLALATPQRPIKSIFDLNDPHAPSARWNGSIMPAYHVAFSERPGENLVIDGDDITLTFTGSWAVLADTNGTCLAIAATPGTSIQRIDPDDDGHETIDGPA
jgi:hypothetical protein